MHPRSRGRGSARRRPGRPDGDSREAGGRFLIPESVGAGEAALLILLGALAFLDGWPAVQTMVSRPIVTGLLAGIVLDSPAEGAFWGAVFEAVYLTVLPVGAARYPDAGLAGLTGTAVAIAGGADGLAPAGWAAAAAAGSGALGDWASTLQRRWNGHTARWVHERVTAGDPSAAGRGVAIALARGTLVGMAAAATCLIIGWSGLEVLGETAWRGPLPLDVVRIAAAAAAATAGARLFALRGRMKPAWLGGVAAGILIAWAAGGGGS